MFLVNFTYCVGPFHIWEHFHKLNYVLGLQFKEHSLKKLKLEPKEMDWKNCFRLSQKKKKKQQYKLNLFWVSEIWRYKSRPQFEKQCSKEQSYNLEWKPKAPPNTGTKTAVWWYCHSSKLETSLACKIHHC